MRRAGLFEERLIGQRKIFLRLRPQKWDALADMFLQRRAIGGDGLLEPRRPALARAKGLKRIAEIVLRLRPTERDALAGIFLQRRAIGGDGLIKPRRPALARAKG